MPSPYAFIVNAGGKEEVFFDPHHGIQRELLQRLSRRVMTGEGPSKFFLRGNRGGGKSVTIRKGLLHGLAMALPGFRYVVVRRNMPDLYLNHLQYLTSEMRKLGGEYVQNPHPTCKYENGSIGFYRQCEDFADVEKIVGAEAAAIFIDEAPQISWENLSLTFPSLRVSKGADGKQPWWVIAILGGNPTGESIEELDKRFIDKDVSPLEDPYYNPDDWEMIPLSRKDNPSIDENEYLKQLGPIPPAFRAAWIDGVRMDARTLFDVHKTIDAKLLAEIRGQTRDTPLPASMEGRPYHYIQELPKIGGVPLLKVPWIEIYRAFDSGYYPDPAAALWLAIVGRRIIAVHEETWFKKTGRECAEAMIATTEELLGEGRQVAMTYADPIIDEQRGAEVTIKTAMEMAGVPIECSVNDRVLYADAIHALLGEEVEPGLPRFQVYEPGCPMLAKYLPKMRWDEKNPRRMADHKFDHWIVDLAYFAISSGVLSFSSQQDEEKAEAVGLVWAREDAQRSRRAYR